MPVQHFDFGHASANLSRNKEGRWWMAGVTNLEKTASTAGMRLRETFFLPRVTPKFSFDADAKIFTMGSCFARNIEQVLLRRGYSVVSYSDEFHERWKHATADLGDSVHGREYSSGYLNKYNTFSMLNEFEWAHRNELARTHPSVVEMAPDRWVDLNAHNILTGTTEGDVRARREILGGLSAKAFEADVIVLTLGLTEAWYDKDTGIYLNDSALALKPADPDRFELRVLSFAENLAAMNGIHAILNRSAKPGWRMIVTVSPVPLLATFTTDDVLTANTYSKSVLRAVAEEFYRGHDNVDYFPSFEMVMNSDPQKAWIPDRRHVAPAMVDTVMACFAKSYLQGA